MFLQIMIVWDRIFRSSQEINIARINKRFQLNKNNIWNIGFRDSSLVRMYGIFDQLNRII